MASILYIIIGRKGIEPSTASAIEFTAQPIIPTNGTFLYLFEEVLLMFIKPVQFPLHEPYFDLTLIKVTHTKFLRTNILIIYLPCVLIYSVNNILFNLNVMR